MGQVIRTPKGDFHFEPTGHLQVLVLKGGKVLTKNPKTKEDFRKAAKTPSLSPMKAELFVGRNLGSEKVWTRGDIRAHAFLLRERQLDEDRAAGILQSTETPGMTVYATQGVFSGPGGLILENSVQITIFKDQETDDDFLAAMLQLAYNLANTFSQDSAILNVVKPVLGTGHLQSVYFGFENGERSEYLSVAKVKEETAWFNVNRLGLPEGEEEDA